MSELEPQNTELLSAFYRDHILTLAKSASDIGVDIFPTGADPSCESYFIDRAEGESYIHSIDRDEMENELKKLWAIDPVPGMAQIARPLLEIAEVLREKEQTSDEVSPFIYAMF